MDPVGAFLDTPTIRRMLRVGVFLALVALFWELLPVLAAFAVSRAVLAAGVDAVRARTRLGDAGAMLLVLAGLLAGAGLLGLLGWGALHGAVVDAAATLPGLIDTLRHQPLVEQGLALVGAEGEGLLSVAEGAVDVLGEAGLLALHVSVGALLGLMFVLEREELGHAVDALPADGLPATLLRWTGHAGTGLALTVQLQVVVAVCNTLLTLPLLLGMGLPYATAALAVLFVLALIPVVGNLVSGAMLAALAWPTWGWVGLAVFGTLTFVLGKIEGFYLNPRLAARHVRLPAAALAAVLVLFEHLFGFAGLFLSFPAVYTALRIRDELAPPVAVVEPQPIEAPPAEAPPEVG